MRSDFEFSSQAKIEMLTELKASLHSLFELMTNVQSLHFRVSVKKRNAKTSSTTSCGCSR